MQKTYYLKDYKSPDFSINNLNLEFILAPDFTQVTALAVYNKLNKNQADLILDGEELELQQIKLNQKILDKTDYKLDPEQKKLIISQVPDNFSLEIIVKIYPEKNTALSGLYKSNKLYCTQCEAEGFRRITYFMDRPDVLTKYTVKIIADKIQNPVLLSNGNLIESGLLDNNQHYVIWHDPFLKPCYLFALVAGNLTSITDYFVTKSKRLVQIKLLVEPQNLPRTAHAMAAIRKAMVWDEEVYNREYDLDIYHIVAVNDFNSGAMENKSLNIFNSKYILATPETATDRDFQNIDDVIGHEYFHNWSGNHVTCRDWFQLSLKEGLTVFREQHFSRDISKSPVALIENAQLICAQQFAEDSGPMSHPVQPDKYQEINNFYTVTIYEKGAEVIRMLQTLLGQEMFASGLNLYFERYDGQAVTIDEFIAAMQDVSGRDLSQFRLWYTLAGTPEIKLISEYNNNSLKLKFTQNFQQPMHIPIKLAIFDPETKQAVSESIIELTDSEQEFIYADIPNKPIISLLRDFSAPIKIQDAQDLSELAFLARHETDAYKQWDCVQRMYKHVIINIYNNQNNQKIDPEITDTFSWILSDKKIPGSLQAKLLNMPSILELIEIIPEVDILKLWQARKKLILNLAKNNIPALQSLYNENQISEPYNYDLEQVSKRSRKNTALNYLFMLEEPEIFKLAQQQYQQADNLTDRIAVLANIINYNIPERDNLLKQYYLRWQNSPEVMDKWFSLQAISELGDTLATVKLLMQDKLFSIKNPNKVYSLIGSFAHNNYLNFHHESGEGYKFLAECILELDKINPQVASRIATPLIQWRKFDKNRQEKMRGVLLELQPNIKSKNVIEVIEKAL